MANKGIEDLEKELKDILREAEDAAPEIRGKFATLEWFLDNKQTMSDAFDRVAELGITDRDILLAAANIISYFAATAVNTLAGREGSDEAIAGVKQLARDKGVQNLPLDAVVSALNRALDRCMDGISCLHGIVVAVDRGSGDGNCLNREIRARERAKGQAATGAEVPPTSGADALRVEAEVFSAPSTRS